MPVQFMILQDWFEVKHDGANDLLTHYSYLCTKQIILKICLKVSSCINSACSLHHVIIYLPGYNIAFCCIMKHNKPYQNLRLRSNRSMQEKNLCNESPCEDEELHHHDIVPKKKKIERVLPVCSRFDSFSSCSSDSAFYCGPQYLNGGCMISAQETLDKMVKTNDNYVTKRTRNSSGSSALSSASDSSNKGDRPLARNGGLKHFITPTKCIADKLPEITSTVMKKVSTAASTVTSSAPVTAKSTIKTIVKEKTVSITCKSVSTSVPAPTTFPNLRKRIRKKRCCDCDCGSNHTTVIVRRFTQIQHRTKTKQYSPQQKSKPKISSKKNKLPSTCSQTIALPKEFQFKNTYNSPNSKANKKRRSEVDKLYDDLHEIQWAKGFSRDNILSQCVGNRRPAASTFTSQKVSSASRRTVERTLQTFQPVPNNFPEITKNLRKNIVPSLKRFPRNQPHTSEPISITYPLLDNSISLETPLSSTVDGTDMFQYAFETTKVTKKVYDSNGFIDTLSVGRACNGICAKNPDESMSNMANRDATSFVKQHNFALSLLQSEITMSGNGQSGMADNVSSSYDSENSSFALDISPPVSDDESSQKLLEISSCHEWHNLNDPPAILECSMDGSNAIEPRQHPSSVLQEVNDASLLSVEPEANNDGIMIIVADIMKFAVESVVNKICIAENQSLESPSLETILKEERWNNSSSVNSDGKDESTRYMEKNKSVEGKNAGLLNDSSELPILSIISSVVGNFTVEDSPPFLEPYLYPSTEMKSSYDNKFEVALPFLNANGMRLDSRSSNNDVGNDMEISTKQLKNSEFLKIPFSERLQHFKSIKKGKAFPIRRKILKKYFRQPRCKLNANQMIRRNTFSYPYERSDLSDENSVLSEANSNSCDTNSNSSDANSNSCDTNSNSFDANSNLSDAISNLFDTNSNSSDANSNSSDANSNSSDANPNSSDANPNSSDANSNSSDAKSDVSNDSYQDNAPTVSFSNKKSPWNGRFESAFSETVFSRNQPQFFRNRPTQTTSMYDWSVPSSSTDYVKDSFVVNCVETQFSSRSKSNHTEKTFHNFYKTSPRNILPIAQPVVSLVDCSTLYSEAQRNSRFGIKNIHEANRMEVINVKSREFRRNVKTVFCRRSALLETSEKGTKSKTDENLLVPFGFTFHYKCITVSRCDGFTKVTLKLTRGKDIYLSAESFGHCREGHILHKKALTELKDTLNHAMDDPNCKVLILTGTDLCFCCGLDLQPLLSEGKEKASKEITLALKKLVEALMAFEKPLVSVVNGKAVGFGVTILTFSDFVLASTAASFIMRYGELGYFPEGAATLMFPHAIGFVKGMEIMLKGIDLSADEAKICRLVTKVVKENQLPYEMMKTVKDLQKNDLNAMQMTKSMMRLPIYHSLNICLQKEEQLLPEQWLSESCQEAMQIANKKGLL